MGEPIERKKVDLQQMHNELRDLAIEAMRTAVDSDTVGVSGFSCAEDSTDLIVSGYFMHDERQIRYQLTFENAAVEGAL